VVLSLHEAEMLRGIMHRRAVAVAREAGGSGASLPLVPAFPKASAALVAGDGW